MTTPTKGRAGTIPDVRSLPSETHNLARPSITHYLPGPHWRALRKWYARQPELGGKTKALLARMIRDTTGRQRP